MDATVPSFFDSSQYMPHGMCYMWQPEILWTSVIADVTTAVAYISFALAVITFVYKRKDLPYKSFFLLAGSFIFLACGASHLFGAVVIWEPMYGQFSILKVLVAVSSVAASALIWKLLPFFLSIPSPSLLVEKNSKLEQEIIQRIRAEEKIKILNGELIKSRDKAEDASRAKNNFLSIMSHEIRTPMNGVLGMAELLGHTHLDKEQIKYLNAIEFSGKVLLTVINDILDHAKIVAGKMEFIHIGFDLRQMIEEAAQPYILMNDDRVALQIEIDPNIPQHIIGDPIRLHQIITNLLNNAFKFTHAGHVKLSIVCQNWIENRTEVKFSISDTGIGIDDETKLHLFQPFMQADQTISRKYGGTGLGLSICQKLIHRMGGKLAVDSTLGNGADFYFQIVFDVGSDTIEKNIQPTANLKDYTALNVLLVEDNQVNQMVAKGMMNKLGVHVDIASDGLIAVDKICKQKRIYDLIMMDCEMPRLDGFAATEQIRQWEVESGRPATPICAMTAHVLQEHVEKCHAIGMNYFLPKPINTTQLRDALNKLLMDKSSD